MPTIETLCHGRGMMLRRILSVLCFIFWLQGMSGCDEDLRPRSMIDSARVLAVMPDPPEIEPGETQEVDAVLIDPTADGSPVEYAIIACSVIDTCPDCLQVAGCLEEIELATLDDVENNNLELSEEDYHTFFERFVRRGTATGQGFTTHFSDDFEVAANFNFLFTEFDYDYIDSNLFVVACREGLCPIMDLIDQFVARDPNALSGEEMLTIISRPELLLQGAPIDGVSLARKEYTVVENASSDTRDANPTFTDVLITDGCQNLSSTSTSCALEVAVNPDSLQSYYLNSTGAFSVESVSVRFFSTWGELTPYSQQVYVGGPSRVSATLLVPPDETPPPRIGFYAVGLDTRSGMAFGSVELER